jgi:hypothetical protein
MGMVQAETRLRSVSADRKSSRSLLTLPDDERIEGKRRFSNRHVAYQTGTHEKE